MNVINRLAVPAVGLLLMVWSSALNAAPANAAFPFQPTPSCGATVYKANGSPWLCTFDDEFSGPTLDSRKWAVPTTLLTGDASNLYSCTPADSRVESVSGGALHLRAIYVSTPVQCNSSLAPTHWLAGTVSQSSFSQTYGRWEAKIRAQAGVTGGFNENFWMFPDWRYTTWNWPNTGEIDVAQQFSWYPQYEYPEAHYGSGTQILGTAYQQCAAQRGVWNTYDLIWTPTSLTFQINGQTCFVNTAADAAFTRPFGVNLSEALWAANASTSGSATMDVDYVRVWQ